MAEDQKLSAEEIEAAKTRRLEAMALQEIEGNPLHYGDVELFSMYEREGWSHERRRADIIERLTQPAASAGDA